MSFLIPTALNFLNEKGSRGSLFVMVIPVKLPLNTAEA